MESGIPQRTVQHLDKLDGGTFPVDSEMLESISDFVGGDPGLIQQFMSIIPHFTLFHSMYLRAVTQTLDSIRRSPLCEENENDATWLIQEESFNQEYGKFLQSFCQERELITAEGLTLLDEMHMGLETRDRFYRYFSGLESQSLSTPGSCAWPLGCVQNLPEDASPFSSELGSQDEHSRPQSLWNTVPNQKMCTLHNRWKGDNLLFDIQGVLYCVFG